MEQYIVSARKYRPDSFESLIGQDNIAKTLKNSILRGQLAHAYLFCGPRGVGKTSTARIFAKTINCMSPTGDMEPCGHCESCVSFDEGRSYCIHELDAASNNGVEDIKQLMDKVRIPPQIGKYSVYIIDEVHMLSQAAFNAFLKTLEEPPAHAIFILATTEKHKILPTILSRCQTYDFNRISVEDIVGNLRSIASREGVAISDESLHVIAAKADGAMRDALTLFDQTVAFCGKDVVYEDVISNLNVLDYDYYFRLVDYFKASDHSSALLLFDEVLSKGFNALYFVSGLSHHLRDLIVSKCGAASSLIELPDSLKARYREQADGLAMQYLYSALEATVKCETAYRSSVNQRLLIEFTLMKLSGMSSQDAAAVSRPAVSVPAASDAAGLRQGVQARQVPPVQPARIPEQPARAAEQPADVSKPAVEQPAPVRKKTGISILSVIDAVSATPSPAASDESSNVSGRKISFEEVQPVWKEMAEDYKSRKNLYSAIVSAKTALDEKDGRYYVRFFVANEAQKEWIRSKVQKELEAKLRKGLGAANVFLAIEVEQETGERQEHHYMPSEKAKYMMEKSEEVRNLCADLGLDLK